MSLMIAQSKHERLNVHVLLEIIVYNNNSSILLSVIEHYR